MNDKLFMRVKVYIKSSIGCQGESTYKQSLSEFTTFKQSIAINYMLHTIFYKK